MLAELQHRVSALFVALGHRRLVSHCFRFRINFTVSELAHSSISEIRVVSL
jgi:hypothetical protein